jgi:SNF2 family DNA or RNA helicase
MEMGCGKTLSAIGIAGILYQFGLVNRVLVVAPLSILGVWESEFESFADFPYTMTILKGTSEKKKKMLKEVSGDGLQVVVVNYESARILVNELLRFDADLIIADEGHKIKENRSKQSKAMHTLGDRASYKLLLTGTLITNKELDVFSQYRFLNSRVFGTSFYAFRNTYFDMVGYGNHIPRFRRWMLDDFLRKLHSIAFRVTKAECLDLPAITEEVRTIQLEPKAQKIYEELEEDSFTELKGSEVTAVNVLTKLLRLSQVTGGHLTDDESDTHQISTAKLEALSDIIDSVMDEGQEDRGHGQVHPGTERHRSPPRKEKGRLRLHPRRRERPRRGGQPFPERPGLPCVRRTDRRGGTRHHADGSKSTMVFYSLDYSMSNFDQAKARIHRVSQTENCHYIYLIAAGTVDRKILRSLRGKIDLAKMLVDDYRKGQNPFAD